MRFRFQSTFTLDSDGKIQTAKTVTYAVMHWIVATAVAYALSGSWAVALGIGLVEPVVQTLAYSLHERGWKRIGAADRRSKPEAMPFRVERAGRAAVA